MKLFHLEDMGPAASGMVLMPKDVLGNDYDYLWPKPAGNLRIELESEEDRSLRFFLDLRESARRSCVALTPVEVPDRKATFQIRVSSRPLIRIDYASNPDILEHRNPDGTKIVGTHVHFMVDGHRDTLAIPLVMQDVVNPQDGVISGMSLLVALMDAAMVTKRLRIDGQLEV